jgi:hypothetical protein
VAAFTRVFAATALLMMVAACAQDSAYASSGCSQDALHSTGGGGLIYCFAAEAR